MLKTCIQGSFYTFNSNLKSFCFFSFLPPYLWWFLSSWSIFFTQAICLSVLTVKHTTKLKPNGQNSVRTYQVSDRMRFVKAKTKEKNIDMVDSLSECFHERSRLPLKQLLTLQLFDALETDCVLFENVDAKMRGWEVSKDNKCLWTSDPSPLHDLHWHVIRIQFDKCPSET